nr:MAG TPA: hypothetical protein [Caudoviricetes sp.]
MFANKITVKQKLTLNKVNKNKGFTRMQQLPRIGRIT